MSAIKMDSSAVYSMFEEIKEVLEQRQRKNCAERG
jgi:hypothetical protein